MKSMKRNVFIFSLISLLLLFSIPNVLAAESPSIYIEEKWAEDYWRNGSIDGTATNLNKVEVNVPNTEDVLQFVRINASNYDRTNIGLHTDDDGNDWNLYRGVISGTGTNVYREGDSDTYTLNSDRPELNLKVLVSNYGGGYDIYNNDQVVDINKGPDGAGVNRMNFTFYITNPSGAWRTLYDDVNVTIRFNLDTLSGADIVNVTEVSDGVIGDSDSDNYNDNVTITYSSIAPGETKVIQANLTIESAVNYADSSTSVNLNEETSIGVRAAYKNTTNSGLISQLTVATRFSRGPVRQGVDMALEQGGDNTWRVRGFFKNAANSSVTTSQLAYTVDEWRIYEVNATSGEPITPAKLDDSSPGWGSLNPDDIKYTGWYDTGGTTKPFYTSYFDWDVDWNGTGDTFSAELNGTLDLENLYQIDISNEKVLTGVILPQSGTDLGYSEQVISINDTVTYLGDSNAKGSNFTIWSKVPYQGTYANGSNTGFINLDINGSSVVVTIEGTDVTSGATITYANSTSGTDGYVKADVSDVSATAHGANLTSNDVIQLTFDVLSTESIASGTYFNFTGNSTVKTESGTPITELFPTRFVNVSDKRLTGWKQFIIEDENQPTLVNVTIQVEAIDKSDAQDGIADVLVLDYVPNGTDMYNAMTKGTATVEFYNTTDWITMPSDNYTFTDNGSVTLSDNLPAWAYVYSKNSTGEWDGVLQDGEKLRIKYQMNVTTSGAYAVPAQIFGLDPATGATFSSTISGAIHVTVPVTVSPMEIKEGDLEPAKVVTVGKPALWIKTFEVFNPNPTPVKAKFESRVFADSIEVYASYYDEAGQKVEESVDLSNGYIFWETTINALETRTYELRVLTPPVLEIDREVEVLEILEGKRVKIKMDIFLKSFAEEDYSNIRLNLPIAYDKVIEVRDAFGSKLAFTGGANSISIEIPSLEAGGVKTVTIIYKESYPAMIVTPDRDRYDLNSPVNLAILVINGGEKVEYPYIELEVYTPEMDILYTAIQNIEDLEPLEKTEVYEKFVIPSAAPAGTYLATAKFRKDFTTIVSATGNFFVMGVAGTNIQLLEILLIVFAGLALVYFSYRRVREAGTKPF